MKELKTETKVILISITIALIIVLLLIPKVSITLTMGASSIILGITSVVAIILSPIIAMAYSERARKINFIKEQKLKNLYQLVSYRYNLGDDRFLESINSIFLLYSDDETVKKDVQYLFETLQLQKAGSVKADDVEKKIIALIKTLCNRNGFINVTDIEIDTLFRKSGVINLDNPMDTIPGSINRYQS